MALILLAQIVCSAPVLRWSKRFGGDIDSSPVLSADRKTLYLGSYDHILYALDTATGSVRWKYTAGLEYYIIDRSTPVLSKDGHVIYAASMVGAGNGNLYAIRAIDGVPLLWNVTLNAEEAACCSHPQLLARRATYCIRPARMEKSMQSTLAAAGWNGQRSAAHGRSMGDRP